MISGPRTQFLIYCCNDMNYSNANIHSAERTLAVARANVERLKIKNLCLITGQCHWFVDETSQTGESEVIQDLLLVLNCRKAFDQILIFLSTIIVNYFQHGSDLRLSSAPGPPFLQYRCPSARSILIPSLNTPRSAQTSLSDIHKSQQHFHPSNSKQPMAMYT